MQGTKVENKTEIKKEKKWKDEEEGSRNGRQVKKITVINRESKQQNT